ncbi:hypothetical protein FB451DRAFT_1369109, partial [Mycena latifolia]
MKCVPPDDFEFWWSEMVLALSSTIAPVIFRLTRSSALYAVLFIFSVYTLAHRNPAGRCFLLLTASAMSLLGALSMVVSVLTARIMIQFNKELVEGSADLSHLKLYVALQLTSSMLLVTNNLVADLVFLYRCYIIWGSKKSVLLVPGLSMLATLVVGCISSIGWYSPNLDPRIPYIMAVGTNVLFICLTAGRIWYKRHEAHIVNCTTFRKRYETVITMILESGALYCLSMILQVISLSFVNNIESSTGAILGGFTNGLVSQAVNIVPTLILVRAGMDRFQWKQDATSIHVPTPSETPGRRRHLIFPSTDPSGPVIHIKQED